MNLGKRLRGRPTNRWQDEVREDGWIVGGEAWQETVHNREEWKKLLRTATNRILHMPMEWMNEWMYTFPHLLVRNHGPNDANNNKYPFKLQNTQCRSFHHLPEARQLHHIETLYEPGHTITSARLWTIKETLYKTVYKYFFWNYMLEGRKVELQKLKI
jgi:hypothetical protein